jgi:hypothetical protein
VAVRKMNNWSESSPIMAAPHPPGHAPGNDRATLGRQSG